MLRQLVHELFRVAARRRLNFKLGANPLLNNFRKSCAPVGRLPDHSGNFIEREEGRIHRRHDHHLTAQHAGCDAVLRAI
jgi:hypothetical protein